MSSTFSCSNCQKAYKRISAYQKHYSICSIIRGRKKKDTDHNDDDDGSDFGDFDLTRQEMGRILKDVLIKYQLMEKKLSELSACISNKRKKIDVIEWLNTNKKVSVENRLFDFATWIDQCLHVINRNHLEYVFEHSFVKLFSYILLQVKEKDSNNIPIFAFTHKDGFLYVYNSNVLSWSHITDDQLKILISSIRVQINAEFKLWQDEHKEDILKDETYHDVYLNNINKVMYTNYKNDEDLTLKVQREIYSNLKIGITI